jgi:type III pantothenate kinase
VRLLAVDIGNTNITLGAFQEGSLLYQWRISSRPFRTSDEYLAILCQLFHHDGFFPERVILGSVVPPLNREWEGVCVSLGVPLRVVRPLHPDLIPLNVETPLEVGIDRVIDSWMALQKYPPPLLVVDFGTASTIDVVGPAGDYRGGVIFPGLELGAEALFRRTALLPQVSVKKPASVIGRNTIDCIQSGLYYGWLEMTRGLVERISRSLGGKVTVITTGGLSSVFAEDSNFADHIEPALTLDGLCLIDSRWESYPS